MPGRVIIVTGVSGSGKTTVGSALAEKLGGVFYDGDGFHPPANVAKMSVGIPLTDEDRMPWLQTMNQFIRSWNGAAILVIACSALKEKYRRALSENVDPGILTWVHLQGPYNLIFQRMQQRKDHFMSAQMLQSQFDAYETPGYGMVVGVEQGLEQILDHVISNMSLSRSAIGLVGLGVMGTSLARNIASKGFSISVYNRHVAGKEENVAVRAAKLHSELANARPFDELKAFVESLQTPRKIILMVNAGKAVDDVIESISPLLQPGDVIMDGGNSHYKDTQLREKHLAQKGIFFVGSGISGGEEGALHGPSIMPGGSRPGFELLKDVLEKIAARNEQGEICCDYIGQGGAGHFVKMVHNGIEYAEMQLIAEVYAHLRYDQGITPEEIADIFTNWDRGNAASYLLGITIDILKFKDADGIPLIDKISDVAGSKGTGSWTAITASELGVPVPAITEALFARYVSSFRQYRSKLSGIYPKPGKHLLVDTKDLLNVYMFSRAVNHHQGLHLILEASNEYGWNIDLAALLRIWSGGCIIRSKLLAILRDKWPGAVLEHYDMQALIHTEYDSIKATVSNLIMSDVGYPTLTSCLEYFKLLSSGRNPSYLLQAQRDYFGAHTYQRVDDPSGQAYHTIWY